MKQTTLKVLVVLAMTSAFAGGSAFAQNPPATENHEAHHPDGQAPAKTTDKPAESGKMGSMKMDGMMGSMNMDNMHGMMKECMDMHKDGKMCEHEMMEKCEANMKKGDCQKMMKQAKAKNKAKK